MSIFDLFKNSNSEDLDISSNEDYPFYEYEKVYSYSEEIPVFDEYNRETDETQIIEGDIRFSGDAEWDEEEQVYVLSTYWEDYGNNFSNNGEAPGDTEEQFLEDFRNYLISQGVNSWDIEQ